MTVPESVLSLLNKVKALTTSPVEGEAQAATLMLAKLLAKHNLDEAALESKTAKPAVLEHPFDLGKAGFAWKLDLADAIADQFFCLPLVNRRLKTVAFVGRPDNAQTLTAVYGFLIDQIKRLAKEERRNHFVRTGEHIDPLRWQLHFGAGAVSRLVDRFAELKEYRAASADLQALVLHHDTELSDWLEEHEGRRADGRLTKKQQEWEERYLRRVHTETLHHLCALLTGDFSSFYRAYPYEKPPTAEEKLQEEALRAQWAKEEARSARSRAAAATRRANRPTSWKDYERNEQAYVAQSAGRKRADDVTLEPFLASE